MSKIKSRSSRRAPPLKESDYDHEISLFDSAADDAEADTGEAGDTAERSTSPSPETLAPNTAIETGDGAGDDSASRRPSALAVTPNSGAVLSPVVTATSATPLLNTLSTVPTAVAGASHSQFPSGGRNSTRYGSISKIISAPSDRTPSVQVEDATPEGDIPNGSGGKGKHQQSPIADQPGRQSMQSVRLEQEAAIDILYENERGGFLCGIPLFSRQALGNLDPSPWTNYAHGTSPTDIHTAQVPDPSWEWAWPEWRINHGDGPQDEDGWEYSFMFAKFFSWHGPTWYSSFVRRRAWIRKRVKRKTTAAISAAASAIGLGEIDSVTDPHLLNPEYFTVVSAAVMRRSSSRASSRHGSRLSLAAPSVAQSSKSGPGGGEDEDNSDNLEDNVDDGDYFEMPKEIADADVLMRFLRAARIDREKIEAVDNFIQYAGEDLVRLQDFMHEIMALFVFQASRRTLLTHLTKAHDAAAEARQKATEDADKGKAAADGDGDDEPAPSPIPTVDDSAHKLQALGRRVGYLTAAVKHADEEVRRLEYWSDIKAMAQRGATDGAVGQGEGWDAHKWQGVDRSGPAPPPPKSPTEPPTS